MWFDLMWCDWCDVMWYDMWYDMWCDTIRYVICDIWCDVIWCDVMWYMTWHDMTWQRHDTTRFDTIYATPHAQLILHHQSYYNCITIYFHHQVDLVVRLIFLASRKPIFVWFIYNEPARLFPLERLTTNLHLWLGSVEVITGTNDGLLYWGMDERLSASMLHSLAQSPLKLGHGWMITSRVKLCICLLSHGIISVKLY